MKKDRADLKAKMNRLKAIHNSIELKLRALEGDIPSEDSFADNMVSDERYKELSDLMNEVQRKLREAQAVIDGV